MIAGIDWGKGDHCSVVVMEGDKVIAAFTGKNVVIHAANWVRLRNLKIKMIMEKEEL